MTTSIKSRLFLITYGIILLFIAGLIVLNNTYLEAFYTESRENDLTSAFAEVSSLNPLTDDDAFEEIENRYNLNLLILKQNVAVEPPIIPGDYPTRVADAVYGNEFMIQGELLLEIYNTVEEIATSGTSTQDIRIIEVMHDETYIAYIDQINPGLGPSGDDRTMVALCVAQLQDDDLYLYYVLTVTIQSIAGSIEIFNQFTIIIGIIFMVLAGLGTFFYSNKFTRPILEMTEVTQDLANLNFDKRVKIKSSDELGVLGDSINRMSNQLEVSIKDLQAANDRLAADIQLKTNIDMMRKEFIANASHELKTPISLIIGYSEALRLPDLSKNDTNEYLNIIDDEANKMNKLVMNLLKISQLESGFHELLISNFSVKDLVDETVKLFTFKMTEKNVNLTVEVDDQFIDSDYDSLQTVLNNFLSNAINHIDGDRVISVQSEFLEEGAIRIKVTNTGKPIPDESLSRIWESFYKVDKARTREYGGQGLGLSIVKITLENLGYKYGVTNLENAVLFYFDIPLNK
ncbi:MAG: HAMP domain-containing sensor histidine kinase [Candidatus Izemoplasmatales bacterium]|nr:HAMP domain-containing sensor histidine kinase [Candidatus Izemoplasmatales bacterium]